MTLWEITFQVPYGHFDDISEAIESQFVSLTAFEVVPDETWEITAYSLNPLAQDEIEKILSDAFGKFELQVPSYEVKETPNNNWLAVSYLKFPPLDLGRFYIFGSHTKNPEIPEGAIPLQVNAGTAFGSGEHQTTQGCLKTLLALYDQGIKFKKPLDMGCGSGILGLAINKLWKVPTVFVDNDPDSIYAAMYNSLANAELENTHFHLSEGFSEQAVQNDGPFDLIVANILAKPLIEMAANMTNNLEDGGYIVLSGLLSRQMPDVVMAYEEQGMTFVSHVNQDDWEALLFQKKQT